MCMKVCVCVCARMMMCERERNKERERKEKTNTLDKDASIYDACLPPFYSFPRPSNSKKKNWGEFFFTAKRRKNTEAVAIIKKSQLCCFDEKTTAPQKFLKNARSVGLRLRENNSSDSLAIVIMVRLCLNDLKGQMIRKTGSHT